MKQLLLKGLTFSSFLLFSLLGRAQEEITLRIGDKAPELKYSKWIKGTPVASFNDDDHLYILEFWATWCGPCKAAMPHLTKLQKEYKGKATIIGVDVWERVEQGEPYESALPMVTKFVNGNSDNMQYAVLADNNDQHMGNKWMKAAGQNGIPATFVIKDEKIIWIGHPLALDTTLPKILNGTYNMQEYKLAFEKKTEASRKQMAEMTAATKPVDEALKAKDYKKAIELMEKAKAAVPILKISMDSRKFETLLKHFSEQEAIAFAAEWAKEFKNAPQYVLSTVYSQSGLSKSTYLWAAKNFDETSSNLSSPLALNVLAAVYAKGGDYVKAAALQEKAVEAAKTALKEGKLAGSVMDYTVTEYEQTLAEYKKAGK